MWAPVASPPAWTTRAAECAPSRASRRRPSLRSKRTPRASSVATWAGPSRQMCAAAATSQSPAPAASVSARWASTESCPSMAAAIPPWARIVLPSPRTSFVTTTTGPVSAADRASREPAMPLPITITGSISGAEAILCPLDANTAAN